MKSIAVALTFVATWSEAATVLITSRPSGAALSIDMVAEKGVKTPARLSLKQGQHTIGLTREGYEPFTRMITVKNRLTTVSCIMQRQRHPIDVFFTDVEERGWFAVVDGRLVGEEKPTMLPATILLQEGISRVVFMKNGYRDMGMRLRITRPQTIELPTPTRGYSSLPKFVSSLITGKWTKTTNGATYEFKTDGKLFAKSSYARWAGSWKVNEDLSITVTRPVGGYDLLIQGDELFSTEATRVQWRLVRKGKGTGGAGRAGR